MDTPPAIVNACWTTIGVRGDGSCPELKQYVHCRNCPVYSAGAMQVLESEAPVDDLAEVVEVLVVRQPPLRAGPVGRVLVGQVDEIGADRLDAEDLHAPVGHPVNRPGRDPAEAVEEGRRSGGARVVVGAEQQDVTVAQLLTRVGDCLLDLGSRHVVPALSEHHTHASIRFRVAEPERRP